MKQSNLNLSGDPYENRADTMFWFQNISTQTLRVARVSGVGKAGAIANAKLLIKSHNNYRPVLKALKNCIIDAHQKLTNKERINRIQEAENLIKTL